MIIKNDFLNLNVVFHYLSLSYSKQKIFLIKWIFFIEDKERLGNKSVWNFFWKTKNLKSYERTIK